VTRFDVILGDFYHFSRVPTLFFLFGPSCRAPVFVSSLFCKVLAAVARAYVPLLFGPPEVYFLPFPCPRDFHPVTFRPLPDPLFSPLPSFFPIFSAETPYLLFSWFLFFFPITISFVAFPRTASQSALLPHYNCFFRWHDLLVPTRPCAPCDYFQFFDSSRPSPSRAIQRLVMAAYDAGFMARLIGRCSFSAHNRA